MEVNVLHKLETKTSVLALYVHTKKWEYKQQCSSLSVCGLSVMKASPPSLLCKKLSPGSSS